MALPYISISLNKINCRPTLSVSYRNKPRHINSATNSMTWDRGVSKDDTNNTWQCKHTYMYVYAVDNLYITFAFECSFWRLCTLERSFSSSVVRDATWDVSSSLIWVSESTCWRISAFSFTKNVNVIITVKLMVLPHGQAKFLWWCMEAQKRAWAGSKPAESNELLA